MYAYEYLYHTTFNCTLSPSLSLCIILQKLAYIFLAYLTHLDLFTYLLVSTLITHSFKCFSLSPSFVMSRRRPLSLPLIPSCPVPFVISPSLSLIIPLHFRVPSLVYLSTFFSRIRNNLTSPPPSPNPHYPPKSPSDIHQNRTLQPLTCNCINALNN